MTALLELRNVSKTYGGGPFGGRLHRAVDRVSLSIPAHTTLGLVGESGCGKSTLSRIVMRLIDADEGEVRFQGADIASLAGRALRATRRHMAIVFQNPYGSLNPRMRVAEIIAAPLAIHREGDRSSRAARVRHLLSAVGLPMSAAEKYPHEFSGGQRQRIAIARALALNPALVICDEAVSALDVSVQAQILNLLKELQAEFALTYLFISHDLSVVEHVSDTIAVMRGGRIVEAGDAAGIFRAPQDPYTRALLAAVPRIGVTRSRTPALT